MKTSYFSNPLLNKEQHYFVQVSNSAPNGFVPDAVLHEVVPDWKTIVGPYKEGTLDQGTYTRRYLAQLDSQAFAIGLRLDTILAAAADKDIILLCYEKDGHFCHRHLLASWLESHPELITRPVSGPIEELGSGQLSLF